MFGGIKPKAVVRKTIKVAEARPLLNKQRSTTPLPSTKAVSKASKLTKVPSSKPQQAKATSEPVVEERPVTNSPAQRKRKAVTPPTIWNDDSDNDVAETDLAISTPTHKRIRKLENTDRKLYDDATYTDGGDFALAHGADLVSGENAAKYRPTFVEELATEVSLQYPSNSLPERFFLAGAIERGGYSTVEDIVETVKFIALHYLPSEATAKYRDFDGGIERRLARAVSRGSKQEFVTLLEEFNALVRTNVDDGTVSSIMSGKHSLDYDWTRRILDQIYSRTVSPHVEILRDYKNGTDNVYGELLYPFVSDIFSETNLRSDQVFVDLGSGVGNVVLQAALEIGCESWGCEMMRNPCELARLQASEFSSRARLWALRVGEIHLLQDDFLANEQIANVLRRADVVLINNQAFGPALNSRLVDRFLDLKDGCRIVSLKSFKPEGFELQERNVNDVRNLLQVTRKQYFSNRVSWTDAPGDYFIATKDPSELIAFQKKLARRER